MIKVNKLSKVYTNKGSTIKAIDNLNLSFNSTGMIFILGKSGSGKTTFINTITGADEYSQGDIYINDRNLSEFTSNDFDELRNIYLGVVSQDYNLLVDYTVYDNVSLPLKIQDGYSSAKEKEKTQNTLKYVGLECFEDRKITELSGGQKQRVAIARALIKDSDIIVADEPTGNLDYETGILIYDLLKSISKNKLVILVSHDEVAAEKYGDRIIKLDNGKILEDVSRCHEYKIKIKELDEDLSEKNMKSKNLISLAREITKISDKNDKVNLNIEIEKEMLDIDKNNQARVLSDRNTKKMTNVNSLHYSLGVMKKRYFKTVLLTLLLSLTTLLIISLTHLINIDNKKAISGYVKNNDINQIYVYTETQYTDVFGDTEESIISRGKVLHDNVSKYFEEKNIVKVIGDTTVCVTIDSTCMEQLSSEILIDVETLNSEYDYIGNLPNSENEICITDYFAHKIGITSSDIGKKNLYINSVEKIVVGIITTNYKSVDLSTTNVDENQKNYVEYLLKRKYNVIFSNIKNQNNSSVIQLSNSNFTHSNYLSNYLDGGISISSYAGRHQVDDLLFGKMPENDNEILVSENFYLEYIGETFSEEDSHYEFIDLYDDKYNGAYSKYLNLYDFYSAGVEIVGVVSDDIDMYVTSESFTAISENYNNYYNYDELGVYGSQSIYNNIDKIINTGVKFNEPNINIIYETTDILQSFAEFSKIIGIFVVLITVLSIYNFMTTNITSKSKEIAIMRSLGVRKVDTAKIFMFENIVITFVSIILVFILFNIGLYYSNKSFSYYILTGTVKFFYLDVEIVLAASIIVFIASFLISFEPMYIISKKKLVEIMNSV